MKEKCFFFSFPQDRSLASVEKREREREEAESGGLAPMIAVENQSSLRAGSSLGQQVEEAASDGSVGGGNEAGGAGATTTSCSVPGERERETERVYLIATRFGSDIYPVRKVAGTRPLATTCDIISPPFWNRWKINFISLKYVKFNKLWLYEVVN